MAGAEPLGANLEVDGGIAANETGQNDLIHISISEYSYARMLVCSYTPARVNWQ
jgi:hypothetical protein